MKRPSKLLPMFMLLLVTASTASAHHSFSMFNRDIENVITGKVVRWAFNNPHSWLYINVAAQDGTETLWSFEAAAPPQLIGRGFTGSSFEPGDTVTLLYCPLVDGRPGGAMGWVKKTDGSFVDPSDGGCNGNEANVVRWQGLLEQGILSSPKS